MELLGRGLAFGYFMLSFIGNTLVLDNYAASAINLMCMYICIKYDFYTGELK